jgi:hypothetical protein
MPQKGKAKDIRTAQGQQLARKLYDYPIHKLENLSADEMASLLAEFPSLGKAEFDYVIQQLVAAKSYEQERVGWQAVPHDIAVLTVVIVTALFDIRAGAVAGVAVLVLLESLFQFYFNQRLYRFLSALVWLTYPAYALLAYILYRRGFELIWIVAAVLLTWGGTFLLGLVARIPARLFYEARLKGKEDALKKAAEKEAQRKKG